LLKLDLSPLPPGLRVGTSSFSWTDWQGVFYPPDLKATDFLSYYATVFNTVEIDATWYAMPGKRTVESWARSVPDGFTFSLKVPKDITHDHYLEGCEGEWSRFLKVLEPLGEKRGPLLFQFPYVAKRKDPGEYASGADFRQRLAAFLPLLPSEGRYVVEVRNASWYDEPLLELLRSRGIALSLVSFYTLPGPGALLPGIDPVTAPFGYIRFIGHRYWMDKLVKEAKEERGKGRDWDELLADRTRDTKEWAEVADQLLAKQREVFVYFNNHFAGFAPGSVNLFVKVWKEMRAAAPPPHPQ
jgi:uncharacterized protein YecE (DUF72 family)